MAGGAQGDRSVRLRVVCETPPPAEFDGVATEFGLQDKRQRLHPGIPSDDGSLRYECDARVGRTVGTEAPRFSGPFVHGGSGVPFLYLGWRPEGTPSAPWIKRIKVSLGSIGWDQIGAGDGERAVVLEARVSGAGSGTVPLLGSGWAVVGDG